MLVTGIGFPAVAWPVVVLVGGSECAVTARNTTAITCAVPRGAGSRGLVVSTPRQSSPASPGLSVVYAAPEVDEVITAVGRPIDGGFPVVVRGRVRRKLCTRVPLWFVKEEWSTVGGVCVPSSGSYCCA